MSTAFEVVQIGDVKAFPDLKPDKSQALKVLEEAAEVYGAWQGWEAEGGAAFRENADGVLSEIADCVQACVNLAAALKVDDLRPAVAMCEARNLARGRYGADA